MHVNPMIRKASLEIPTTRSTEARGYLLSVFTKSPQDGMCWLISDKHSHHYIFPAEGKRMEKAGASMMAFPRTFQQASAALATRPLVCLTEGARLQPHDIGEWQKGSCLARPSQTIPGCTVQDTTLGMGFCCTLEGGKLNSMAKS